ncbi:unnamed protein product [Cladocopium goreaui]|uniref:Uncharacterized protein n=1 Tax=Cladocopium goreaui TaxID=2562237 RepID=A0A9P1FJM1_9DINO|nr:unnamed protein product [Cladocopium goreaui]
MLADGFQVETCSASDDQKVQYIESELVGLSNWAIAEDVNEAMELVTGELEAEYEVIESDGLTIGTKSWTDRLQQVGENAAELAGKSAAKKVSKKFLSTFGRMSSPCCIHIVIYIYILYNIYIYICIILYARSICAFFFPGKGWDFSSGELKQAIHLQLPLIPAEVQFLLLVES